MRREIHLDGAAGATILTPKVVEVEGDETEDGDVEKDFPARDETAVAVEMGTPVRGRLATSSGGSFGRKEEGGEVGKTIAFAQLVCEEDADVENPGGPAGVSSGESGGDLVIESEDGKDFEGGDAVEGEEEDGSKGDVESGASLESGVGEGNLRGEVSWKW